jgi:Tfp pilus assembly protein PilN
MIKINLLGLKKEVKKSAGVSAPVSLEGAKIVIFAVLFTAAGIGWVAYRHITLSAEETKIAEDYKKAQAEQTKLAAVKVEVEQQEAIKKLLTRQIDVIDALKRGRTGPTEMLNTVANTVVTTKTMWLTTFDTTGNKVNMAGLATSMITVSDFVEGLKRSGLFNNIEMKETAQDDRVKELKAYSWEINAEIVLPPSTDPKAAAAPPAAGKAK